MSEINDLLTKHERKSVRKFTYENPAEMMKTQLILIKLSMLLQQSFRDFDEQVGSNIFKCMRLIFEREEFFLNYIGFQKDSQIKRDEQKDKRVVIGLLYQRLLYQVLGLALEMLSQTILGDFEKKFVEFYLAYAYFRISEFKEQFLQQLYKYNKMQFESTSQQYINLDWENDFFKVLEGKGDYEENKKLLSSTLKRQNWIQRLVNSPKLFCSFLCEWCSHVEYSVISKDIMWEEVQGYRIMTHQYLTIIKEKSLNIDDPKFIQAGQLLLNNPDNVNLIITHMVENTNLFDQKNVISFFKTLSKWFRVY